MSNNSQSRRRKEYFQEHQKELEVYPKEEVQELKSTVDPILSHKLIQFSTSTTVNEKGSLLHDIKAEIEGIPIYLTKQNNSFQQMIHHVQSTITTATTRNNSIDELRKIAILIYEIMVIQTYQLLWTTYLRSGTGKLIVPSEGQPSYPTTIPIWPKEMKILLYSSTNDIYLNFVNNHLQELDHQLKRYQNELNINTNNYHGYTLNVQKLIETYIEQNLRSFRMKIEHQIELIHYDYHIRALKLEYFRHNPNKYQEQVMKEICRNKYEQETTTQELDFLKQQITYYNSPSQSFECSRIAQSTLIDSVVNPVMQQQLFKRYQEMAVQSRADLFQIYLKSAEDQQKEYKKKFKDSVKNMQSDQHSFDENRKIPLVMIQLILERCTKISERIKCVYKFKAQSIPFQM